MDSMDFLGSAESSPSPTGQGTMHGSLATHGSLAEAAKVQHEKSKDDKVWADGTDMEGLSIPLIISNNQKIL